MVVVWCKIRCEQDFKLIDLEVKLDNFRPLVVGAPRSGFALLSSVVIHFIPFVNHEIGLRQKLLNALMRKMGSHLSDEIIKVFAAEGITQDLLYNPNFRYVVGGPKWIPKNHQNLAYFRKYIGVKGKGDFTLVTAHPHELLAMDEIVHSHTDPKLWLEHPHYQSFTKFASVRNPVDILNSSVFSLNALASEYIQKFIPPELDNDNIRQELALYKCTDLTFFEGLVKFLAGYFDEFMQVYDRFILMRWEDLIAQPIETIMRLAQESGVSITEDYARGIWKKLDHVNLTQAHKHNYRVGHGVLDGWKYWMTNHHLKMIKSYGFDKHLIALGYGEITYLDEANYTDFQKRVSQYIDEGKVYQEFFDPDLFTFAFNKSNLVSDKFPFKRYDWRTHTQIERSIFTDEALQQKIWDCAEKACGELNDFIADFLASSKDLNNQELVALLDRLQKKYRHTLGNSLGKKYDQAFSEAKAILDTQSLAHHKKNVGISILNKMLRSFKRFFSPNIQEVASAQNQLSSPPVLVNSAQFCNVVHYNGRYYALPHKLGAIDLDKIDEKKLKGLDGVLVTKNLESVIHYAKAYKS